MHASGTPTQSRGAPSISSPPTSSLPTASNAGLAAALKGATLAFQGQSTKAASTAEKPTRPSPNPVASSADKTNDEALRAATQAARDVRSRSPVARPRNTNKPDLNQQGTGGRTALDQRGQPLEQGQVAQRLSQHLLPPVLSHAPQTGADTRPSASYIAATLAASRSGSPSPTPGETGGFVQAPMSATQIHSRILRRPSLDASSVVSLSMVGAAEPDVEPIQPTGSLISLFESRRETVDVDPVKKRDGPSRLGQEQMIQLKARLPTPPRSRSPEITGKDQKQQRRQAPETRPKPPPSVAIRTATLSESDITGATVTTDPNPNPRLEPGTDPGERQQPQGSTARAALGRRDKNTAKPSVARRLNSVPQPTHAGESAPLAPTQHVAQRPLANLVSPEPRRVVKIPRLDPPQLPRRGAAELEDDWRLVGRRASQNSVSSNGTFVSAMSTRSTRAESPVKQLELPVMQRDSRTPLSGQRSPILRHPSSSPTPRPTLVLRRPTAPNASSPSLALDSLTNAIVASNLASTRLGTVHSSPGPPPLPAPRRQNRPRSPQHLQPQRTAESLISPNRTGGSTKSPSGRSTKHGRTGMLQTLRAPPLSLSDDEDARRRMHRTRKKPMHPLSGGKKHAHNEGARRRWRDEVSVRERRRYEAVWASNRGLFLRPGWAFSGGDDVGRAIEGTAEADLVANVLVRDIWNRSRLPADELTEVWELVDRRGDGTLGRMEFVVGMWLVDQRLRGRKIPARVSESVWASVRGVVVPGPRGRKR